MELWHSLEDTEINPHTKAIWFLTEEQKHMLEKTASSTHAVGKTGYPHVED
jgi:hypothetical protein